MATQAPPATGPVPAPFDRALVRWRRHRAAATLARADFLFAEIADRLVERLGDVKRDFPLALDLGCRDGVLSRALLASGRVGHAVAADLAPAMARAALAAGITALAADEEALPFADGAFDLVASLCTLDATNDLPGALVQIRRALKPDGLLLAALFGGETLTELREAWLAAEIAEEGGAGPRISPFVTLDVAAGLLQRAGFALPVADLDTITVTYSDALALMADLRAMGVAGALSLRRRTPTRRATLARVVAEYASRHATEDGRARATFQIVWLAGWAPAPGQPQPKPRGSASASLAGALGATERGTGDHTGGTAPHRG
ncbi:MAG: methyltransferase domain-containing protein [Alphaproteobacteria bacterium]|nr:methyltransferase domain-containing protein [Alphaproteobacteria bacterium]